MELGHVAHLELGMWRTLLDNKNVCRPQKRTELVAFELNLYNIDIVAQSEAHIESDGQREEIGGGFTISWKG